MITYTTEADMSDRIDPDGADVTNRVKTPEDSDNGTQHVDSGDNTVDIQKKMIETTQLTINWEASFTVPKTGLSEAVLTDTYPSMVLYQDTLNGSITVTGTDPDTERYTIDTSHTGYATITFEKKVDEKWVPGLHGADSERTIFVELTTNNDQDWVTQGADFSYLRSHTNTVSLKVGDESIEANASGSPTKQTFSKTGTQVGTVIIDGVELPVFKYTLRLTGVSRDTVTITDTYDKHLRFYSVTETPHPTGYSSSDQKLKGGDIGILGFYASDRSGRVDPIQDADNNTLTFDNVKVVKDGEDYYPVYELVYYMVVKDKANVKDVAQTSLSNNCYYKFDNQAKWVNANLDAKASVNYLAYPMSKKAAGNASQANDFTDTFTIVLNPNAIRLNNGEDIKVEDTLTNLNVDFSTMNIVLEPARDDYDVEWTFNDNVGTFWIPDETKVIITYHARAVGEAGTNVSYSNTARMLSYRATDGSTVKIIGSGGGTYDPSYRVKLYKYENNTMNVPLAGASFQLYDADQNVMTYQKDSDSYDESLPISHTNHKIGDPVTFTTGDNGYAEIRLYGDDQDGLVLGWMTDYYLYETVVPDGYEKEDIYWHFKIGATDSSDLVNHKYTFHNGGIVKVSNTKKENALVLKKAFSGTELTEAQKRNITFTVVGTNAEKVVFRRSITYAEFTGGQYRFKKLPAGNYTITESNQNVSGYVVTSVVQVDEGDTAEGTEAQDVDFTASDASHTVCFTNTYTQPVSIEKVWSGGEPDETELRAINIDILKDGEVVRTVMLSRNSDPDKNWKTTITDLEFPGNYTFREQVPSGYALKSTVYTKDGKTVSSLSGSGAVTITNEKDTTSPPPDTTSIYLEKKWYKADSTTEIAEDESLSATVELLRYKAEKISTTVHFRNNEGGTVGGLNDIEIEGNATIVISYSGKQGCGTMTYTKVDVYGSAEYLTSNISTQAVKLTGKDDGEEGSQTITVTVQPGTADYYVYLDSQNPLVSKAQCTNGAIEEPTYSSDYAIDDTYESKGIRTLNYGNYWKASFANLPEIGTGCKYKYGIREVAVPSGFELMGYTVDGKPLSAEEGITEAVEDGKPVVISNRKTSGSVKVTKVFAGLEPAEYPEDFKITAAYNDGTEEKSVELTIDKATGSGTARDPYTWIIEELSPGTVVTFVESDYEVAGYTITTMPVADETTGEVKATAEAATVPGVAAFTNTYDDHSFVLTKVDAENGGKKLPGAVFTVYEWQKTAEEPETFDYVATEWTYTSDENGVIKVKDTDHDFKPNTAYCLMETMPPTGYALNNTRYPFWFYTEGGETTAPEGFEDVALNLVENGGSATVRDELVGIIIKKLWSPVPDGIDAITVNVKNKAGRTVKTVGLDRSNGWEAVVTDLSFEEGDEYTFEEQSVTGYELASTVYRQAGRTGDYSSLTGPGSVTFTNISTTSEPGGDDPYIVKLPDAKSSKVLEDLHDGTYKLTLSVTIPMNRGRSKNKANVVIVYDSSNSMNRALGYKQINRYITTQEVFGVIGGVQPGSNHGELLWDRIYNDNYGNWNTGYR